LTNDANEQTSNVLNLESTNVKQGNNLSKNKNSIVVNQAKANP
jgi:hypothetical protein